jgi:hypothetical protein
MRSRAEFEDSYDVATLTVDQVINSKPGVILIPLRWPLVRTQSGACAKLRRISAQCPLLILVLSK